LVLPKSYVFSYKLIHQFKYWTRDFLIFFVLHRTVFFVCFNFSMAASFFSKQSWTQVTNYFVAILIFPTTRLSCLLADRLRIETQHYYICEVSNSDSVSFSKPSNHRHRYTSSLHAFTYNTGDSGALVFRSFLFDPVDHLYLEFNILLLTFFWYFQYFKERST
jgi:hypothetical protein